jgi:protein TonB
MSAQVLLVAALALLPVMRPNILPRAQLMVNLVAPGPPTRQEPASRPQPATPHVVPTRTHTIFRIDGPVRLPTSVPAHPVTIEDPPAADSSPCNGCIPGPEGPASNIVTQILNFRPVVPQRPPERAASQQPQPPPQIRLRASDVRLGHPIYRVEPKYPPMAIIAHISGPVELEAIIATDGHIREVHALSGNPLLVPAALEAVRQWVYEPTLLNGKPVEVIAPITVIFRLDRQ